LAGVAARRRFVLGAAGIVLLTGVAAAVALLRPEASAGAALPAAVAMVVGLVVLRLLTPGEAAIPVVAGPESGTGSGPGRRGLLLAGGLALALATTGEWIGRARTRIADVVLPAASRTAPPLPAGLAEQ